MNEHINLIESGLNQNNIEKALDFYYSIEEMHACWGISDAPMIENSIKINSSSVSYNRYSIPILGINNTSVWQKTEKLLDIMNAPKELYDVIKNRHKQNVRIIAGLNFDMNDKRIYFHEMDEGYGYEFNSTGNWDLKTYSLVSPENYKHVIKNLKRLISSKQIYSEVMNIIPLKDWNQVSTRNTLGLTLGYHISTYSKMRLELIENHIFALVSGLNPSENDFMTWFEKNKNTYLHWLGIGYNEKAGLEITIYLRCNEETWDSYYPPSDLITYLNKRVFNIG